MVEAFQLPFDITKQWILDNAPLWFVIDNARSWFFDDYEVLQIRANTMGINIECSPYNWIVLQDGVILPYTESMFFANFEETNDE